MHFDITGSELEAESEYQEHYEAEAIHCEPSLQGLSQLNEDPKDRSMMCMAELVQGNSPERSLPVHIN